MSISVSCPHCNEAYALTDQQAGKTVRCPACRSPFTVRTPNSSDDEEEDERPRRRRRRDRENRDEPRGRRRHGIPLWAWLVGGGVLVLLVGVLVIVLLKGGVLGGSNHRLTRENFEKVKKDMPDREVVQILGKPTRAEGTFGQRISWDKIEALKTFYWESGSTKISVTCTGGAVNHMTGTFKDDEIKPAAWTEANFDKLSWNQSRAEVRTLLGPPVEISGGLVVNLTPGVNYIWKDGTNEIMVLFEGDRLYSAQGNFNGKLVLVRSRPSEVPDAKLPVGPSKVTEENFRKIKPNMTLDEVRAILGPPQIEGGGGFSVTWMDKHNNNVQVLFQDKKVALASAFINGKHLDALAAPGWVPPPGVPPADH
jgi:predicted Zn finger-like uncharacterized protein